MAMFSLHPTILLGDVDTTILTQNSLFFIEILHWSRSELGAIIAFHYFNPFSKLSMSHDNEIFE